MKNRLYRFLFEPQSWISAAEGNVHLARHYQQTLEPVATFREQDYTETLEGRLVLLTDFELELLGFAIAVSPFCTKIAKSIDGRFKKAIKARFSDEQIASLDDLVNPIPTFLLPSGSFANPEQVARGGIQAILQWGNFTPAQRQIIQFRVPNAPLAVEPINHQLVEELCKISLPNLPWLLNGTASTSQQEK